MKTRHEPQLVQTLAGIKALNNTEIPNQPNDIIIWGDKNRLFRWVPGDTTAGDDEFVIEQTDAVALGRWIAIAARKVTQGAVTIDATSNGQSAINTGTVTGVDQGAAVAISYDTSNLPANMFVESACISADNTVRLVVTNETGGDAATFDLDVTVIEF